MELVNVFRREFTAKIKLKPQSFLGIELKWEDKNLKLTQSTIRRQVLVDYKVTEGGGCALLDRKIGNSLRKIKKC